VFDKTHSIEKVGALALATDSTLRTAIDRAAPLTEGQAVTALAEVAANPGEAVGRLRLTVPRTAVPFVIDPVLPAPTACRTHAAMRGPSFRMISTVSATTRANFSPSDAETNSSRQRSASMLCASSSRTKSR